MADDKTRSKHRHSRENDGDSEKKSRKRHKHEEDGDRKHKKKRKHEDKGSRIVDDDPDEDLWVEKNIDMDGERVRCT